MSVTAEELDLGIAAVEAVMKWYNDRRALASQVTEITEAQLTEADAKFARIVADPLAGDKPIPPTPAPGVMFAADPTVITAGQSSSLSWMVTNANTVSVDNGVGTQPAQSGNVMSEIVTPDKTTTYTLVAHGNGGAMTKQVTVTVNPVPPPPPVEPPATGATYDAALPAGSSKPSAPPYQTGDHIYSNTAGRWMVAHKETTAMDFGQWHYESDVA